MAQLVMAAAGATVGFMVGGPTGAQIGWSAGSMLGSALFGEAQKFEGPKLGDLTTIGSNYGTTIPYVMGTTRLAGQIVWASSKREIPHEETQGKGGGKQSSTTYTYEVDAFILLTDNEISGIRRIWANGELIFSQGEDASLVSLVSSSNSTWWARCTVYKGNSTQLPDPTYESAVGSANACAYRGRGGVFIEALQLGNSGAIPNLTFEVVSVGNIVPYGWLRDTRETQTFNWTPAYDSAYLPTGGPFGDPCLYTYSLANSGPYALNTSISDTSMYNLGTSDFTIEGWVRNDDIDLSILYLQNTLSIDLARTSLISIGYNNDFGLRMYTALMNIRNPITNAIDTVELRSKGLTGNGTWSHWVLQRHNNELKFLVDGMFDGTNVVAGVQTYGSVVTLNPDVNFDMGPTGPDRVFIGGYSIGGYIGAIKISNISRYPEVDDYATPTAPFTFDIETVIDLPFKSYDRLPKGSISLVEAVTRLCTIANIPVDKYDVSGLSNITMPVYGVNLSQVSTVRALLDTLSSLYMFESYISDKLYFVPIKSNKVLDISNVDLGFAVGSEGSPPYLNVSKSSDLEIPNQLALTYSNILADYQTDTQYSFRITNTTQDSTSKVDTPVVLSPEEAKKIVDMQMFYKASASISTEFSLSSKYLGILPTDVIYVVDSDGLGFLLKVKKIKEQEHNITVSAELYSNSSLEQTGITSSINSSQTSVAELPVAVLRVLDIPLLNDSLYLYPGLYLVASNYTPFINNTINIKRSTDSTNYYDISETRISGIIGTTNTKLDTGVFTKEFDEMSYVDVELVSGELQSVSRSDILISQSTNAALIGDEIVQFTNAALIDTNKYRLTGLIRGLKGTEWAQSTHTAKDRFVLLDSQTVSYDIMQTSDIGFTKYYKAFSTGQLYATAKPVTEIFDGISSKPLSPFSARVNRDSTDTIITWYRRTRLSSNLVGTNIISAPLGETTEAYDIEIYVDSSFTTVKRTISTVTNTTTYTSAQQVADFGSNQSVLYLKIYQKSSTVGRGYPLQVTL